MTHLPTPRRESARTKLLEAFEQSVQTLYIYFLYCTFNQSLAQDLTVDLYSTLLHRKRTLWWRHDIFAPVSILKMARRIVRRVSRWKVHSAMTDFNLQAEIKTSNIRILHKAIESLPREKRELAVLGVLSNLPHDTLAELYGSDSDTIALRIEDIEQILFSEAVPGRHALSSTSSQKLIASLKSYLMPDEELERIRYALLAQLDRAVLKPLRSVAVVGMLLLIPITLSSLSAFVPFALEQEMREIASIEVLLSGEVRDYDRTLASIENSLEGIGAHVALEDVEKITLELAAYALSEHADEREELDAILEQLGTKLLPQKDTETAFLTVGDEEFVVE